MVNRMFPPFLLRAIVIASVLLSGHCALFGAPTNTLQSIAYTNQGKSQTLLEFKTKEAPDYEIFENIGIAKSNMDRRQAFASGVSESGTSFFGFLSSTSSCARTCPGSA